MIRFIGEMSIATLLLIFLILIYKNQQAEPEPVVEPTGQLCVDLYMDRQYVAMYSYPIKDYQLAEIQGLDMTEPFLCIEDSVNIY